MNNLQQDMLFYAGLYPLGKTSSNPDSNFVFTQSPMAENLEFLQRMLEV